MPQPPRTNARDELVSAQAKPTRGAKLFRSFRYSFGNPPAPTGSSPPSSGTKFECAKEECCPVTGQKVQGRDQIIIESNDRIVVNVFKTIDGKERKVMEIVSVRK